jgi:hypothetical protein
VNGELIGEGRGGFVGCTEFDSEDKPWCATQTVNKDGKEVYISGNGQGTAWQYCDKESVKNIVTTTQNARQAIATSTNANDCLATCNAEKNECYYNDDSSMCDSDYDNCVKKCRPQAVAKTSPAVVDYTGKTCVYNSDCGEGYECIGVSSYWDDSSEQDVIEPGKCQKIEQSSTKVSGLDENGNVDVKAIESAIKVEGVKVENLKLSANEDGSIEVKYLQFEPSGGYVTISLLTVDTSTKVDDWSKVSLAKEDSKVVVSGLKGVKHELGIQNTKSSGVKVCPEAVMLAEVKDDCVGKVVFTHDECVKGVTKSEVRCSYSAGSNYYFVSVSGSGADENGAPTCEPGPTGVKKCFKDDGNYFYAEEVVGADCTKGPKKNSFGFVDGELCGSKDGICSDNVGCCTPKLTKGYCEGSVSTNESVNLCTGETIYHGPFDCAPSKKKCEEYSSGLGNVLTLSHCVLG